MTSRRTTEALSVSLRARTRPEHRAAERLADQDRLLTSASGVRALLTTWAEVWSATSERLRAPDACDVARRELEHCARQGLDRLAADLADLAAVAPEPAADDARSAADDGEVTTAGAAAEPDPARVALDALADPAGSRGVAYVLLGSRIGGRVIAVRVAAAVRLPSGRATRFLAGEGVDAGREWVAFHDRLDTWAASADPRETERTLGAARATFRWTGAVLARHTQAALSASAPTRVATP